MTVIDLDVCRPAAEPSSRPPVRALRPAGLVLALVLVFALGGAAPVTTTLFRGVGQISLAADDLYSVGGGYLLTVESPREHPRLSAWRTDPVRRLWTTELDPGVPPVLMNTYGIRLTVTGDWLLAQAQDYRTTAVDLRTGRKLWQLPVPVNPVAPGLGLARTETFPPGSETERDGAGGLIFISPTGVQYRKPPLTTDIAGIDLATGRTLWTRHHQGSASATAAGPRLLAITESRFQLLNPENGQVLTERTLPKISGIDIVDDVVIVAEDEQTAAYDARTLEPRWRAPVSRTDDYLNADLCLGLICRNSPAGAEVVDPATGRALWATAQGQTLRRDGPVVLETESTSRRPLRLLDATTGEVRATLSGWQMVTQFGAILLTRVEPGGKKISFGMIRGTRIQPLGYADITASECRADSGLIACRTFTGLDLFAYQAG